MPPIHLLSNGNLVKEENLAISECEDLMNSEKPERMMEIFYLY